MTTGTKYIHNYVGDLNITALIINRMSTQKINKDIDDWNH